MEPLLSVKDISIQFTSKKRTVTAVDHVSFDVKPGEILGIVGESGCGKSVTSLAIMRLLADNAKISGGSIFLDGKDLVTMSEKEMCKVRGNEISMIFQDPMTALNPTMTIGRQLSEPFMIHQGMSRTEAESNAIEMLRKVGISSPEKRMKEYSHQMSGGMLQRIVIAMALACRPKLLIADEPTTALDVTIQAQILDLIRELRDELNTAVILITHDMGVVAETADRVLVLYAGRTVEQGAVEEIFEHPHHPYTQALLKSIPNIYEDEEKLNTIRGTVPMLDQMPEGCRFAPRCDESTEKCKCLGPQMYPVGNSFASCMKYMPGERDE